MARKAAPKAEATVVGDNEVESGSQRAYRPTRWQSNLTILSCVSRLFPMDGDGDGGQWSLITPTAVYRQLQRWFPEPIGQPHQCHFQEIARIIRLPRGNENPDQ